jgi:hypothetical protein
VRDLGSTNGTFVNGLRVEGTRALGHGDEVVLGHEVRLRVRHAGTEGGGELVLRDLAAGTVHLVEGDRIHVGSGATSLPPMCKSGLLDLRRGLREAPGGLTSGLLRTMSEELRDVYFELREEALAPRTPDLCNTDGDPVRFHTLTYRIESAEVAFHALKSLAEGETEEDLLREARFDQEGALGSVRFRWLKRGNKMHETWENTILGQIEIEETSMTVKVNSAKRAKKIETEIAKRLGRRATLVNKEVRSAAEAMKEEKPAYLVTRISTRRFFARPASVALGATGFVSA